MQPRVAIIYLCWGMVDYVDDVVEAIAAQTYDHEALTCFMVTAGSTDGIQEKIKRDVLPRSGKDLPKTVLLDDPVNRGFAGNNNVAVRQALEEGFDYIFLHNGDLKLHQDALKDLVRLAESDETIGSAQSLVLYWNDHNKVNVSGGVFHVAGYAYARDNLTALDQVRYEDGEEVAYASGAAALYRSSVLKEVGLMEEGFFMYHEDLELGLRMRMAGYRNVLAATSWAYHDYQFSRNPKKFAWMEVYRWVVVGAFYKWPTLVFLSPLLVCVEIGTWFMALRGGWIGAKVKMVQKTFDPKTWKLFFKVRRRAQALRRVDDRELLKFVSGRIEAQEQHNWIVEYVANPVLSVWLAAMRFIVRW